MLEDYMVKSKYQPGKYLYIKVTADKYELPIVVADSIAELAQMCGVTISTVYQCLRRKGNSAYKRVRLV